MVSRKHEESPEVKFKICKYCSGCKVIYKDREGIFANLDGCGDYDIFSCHQCTGQSEWIECSRFPERDYPGIRHRGVRERNWFEVFGSAKGKQSKQKVVTFGPGGLQSKIPKAVEGTKFYILAARCHAVLLETSPVDYKMTEFFEALEVYCSLLKLFGSATKLVLGDLERNLTVARAAYLEEPRLRGTLRGFLRREREGGQHKFRADGSLVELKNPSGALQLQWLLRGLEFFATFLDKLFDGDVSAAQNAYAVSLQAYHNRFTSTAFRTAILAMPNRKALCSIKDICPDVTDVAEREHLVVQSGKEAASVLLSIVKGMITTCKEFNLWDSARV